MENRDLKPVAGWHGELPCAFFAFLRADRHEALKGPAKINNANNRLQAIFINSIYRQMNIPGKILGAGKNAPGRAPPRATWRRSRPCGGRSYVFSNERP